MDSRAQAASRGHTLLELTVSLALVAVVLATVVLPAGRLADRWAVVATRDDVASLAHRVRLDARLRGEASLVLFAEGRAEARTGDSVTALRRPSDAGVTLDLGGADSVVLRWDALGVGRIASRTVRLRRGTAETALVFSSTGRVRRR